MTVALWIVGLIGSGCFAAAGLSFYGKTQTTGDDAQAQVFMTIVWAFFGVVFAVIWLALAGWAMFL